ncbi:hypothetical protein KEM54_000888 [Ascosphaera aggregata]|nr:hypothetical protein KEM54_000888 [Ascosphaera aggregata]
MYGDLLSVVSRHQDQRLTFFELDCQSNSVARGLAAQGVTYAIYKLGAILVPVNPSLTDAQLISAIKHVSASHLILGTETKLSRQRCRANISTIRQLLSATERRFISESPLAIHSLKSIIFVGSGEGELVDSCLAQRPSLTSFKSLLSSITYDRHPLPPQGLDPDDTINIQFTSGTTSNPKAACLTHHSILNNAMQIGDRMGLTAEDVVCSPPPLFHCFGSVIGYLASITHASTFVLPSEIFDAEAALLAVKEENCTALHGVPTMFIQMLDLLASGRVRKDGLERLRTGVTAGSSIPVELMKKLHKELNLTELNICYGMTETSPVSFMTACDDPLDKRVGTVGRILPHVEAKVVNPADRTQTVGVGEKGEFAVSGYPLMKGYWNDPERTAEVMVTDAEGRIWMHVSWFSNPALTEVNPADDNKSGDEASLSADGYLTITGRIKDLIIRGGENIYPLEIENCLLAHPDISDVCVVGVPDEKYGESVAAFVVPRDDDTNSLDEAGIKNWVSDRLVRYLDQSALPKTGSGKIQKYILRQRAVEILKGRETKK